jgi:hypothetical protein
MSGIQRGCRRRTAPGPDVARPSRGSMTFTRAPAPTQEQLAAVVESVATRVRRLRGDERPLGNGKQAFRVTAGEQSSRPTFRGTSGGYASPRG